MGIQGDNKMSYKLDKPFTNKQRADFVVNYNHKQSLTIEETDKALYALQPWEILQGDEVVDNTQEYEAQQAQEEAERIKELSMTRSDFFDATIKAFGADEDALITAISGVIVPLGIDNTAQKIALNNYKNALNFYRKHPLFTMLSNVPIQISETLTITITPEQWDKFFDKTDKKNPDAYKELLPKEGGDIIG